MRGKRAATDAATKARALQVAEQHGAAEASRQTGVPPGTIRSWLSRTGKVGPPAGVDAEEWAASKEDGAREAWAAAQEALAKVREHLAGGKTRDAKDGALTMAILIDKSGVLEEAAQRRQVRQVRIAEDQAALLVQLTERYFEAVGLTLTPAARKTLRHLLDQAQAGAPMSSASPEAEEARADIRRQVGSELLGEQRELGSGRERRSLPAPRDGEEERPAEAMAGPVRKVTTRGGDDAEVLTGEVVEASPQRRHRRGAGHPAPMTAEQRVEAERARREAELKRRAADDPYADPDRWFFTD